MAHHDPALDSSHQHTHAHLHHNPHGVHSGNDEPIYTKNTSEEPSMIPTPDPGDHLPSYKHGEKSAEYDVEQGKVDSASAPSDNSTEPDPQSHKFSKFYRKYRVWFHITFWIIGTGWWTAGLGLHYDDKNWVVPFLLWLCLTIRLVTFYVPASLVMKPLQFVWLNTCVRVAHLIPEKLRLPAAAFGTVAVVLVGSFASKESADNTRENRTVSLFGLIVLIAALWATSRNRKIINWQAVIVGFLIQFIIALFVLRTSVGYDIFKFVSDLCIALLGFAKDGVAFLTDDDTAQIGWFLLSVLPAIIFFISIVQLLYYWGTIQWFIGKFAVFFFWAMKISGAEAVVAAGTPFIGQGESAMLIKPFVAYLTKAELHQVLCSGFATIAGSVLVAYIGMGINPQALISSCVMSIPASLAVSKMRYPEEEEPLTSGKVVVPDDDEHKAANFIQAFANGAWLGLKIAGTILATILCIIAFVALVNGILTWFGRYLNLTGEYDLTIQLVLSYVFYPVAFLLGVPRGPDLLKVARLLGTKVIVNEFVAYNELTTNPFYDNLSPRSRLIATYSLCGFGNVGSLGTQIGVLTQLAPGRSGDVSRLAISALLTGVLSTLSSASIAGLVIQDQQTFI